MGFALLGCLCLDIIANMVSMKIILIVASVAFSSVYASPAYVISARQIDAKISKANTTTVASTTTPDPTTTPPPTTTPAPTTTSEPTTTPAPTTTPDKTTTNEETTAKTEGTTEEGTTKEIPTTTTTPTSGSMRPMAGNMIQISTLFFAYLLLKLF